ncbi:MAG: SRPBCC family protein [bacterium]
MSNREKYSPGAAAGAEARRDGDRWTLVLVRELRHPPEKVWQALTEPEQLREWAPFDADRNLDTAGTVKLSTVGTPIPQVSETNIKRAEAPRLLEYNWGGNDIRWELEPLANGTRLTLWHNIGRKFIAMGAAGWHICFDVLDRFLEGHPIGRIVAGDALKFGGWQRLHAEYARQFDIEAIDHTPQPE